MQTIITKPTQPLNPLVATIGFFDGVHCGHRFLLNELKEVAASLNLSTALVTFPVHPRRVLQSDFQPQLLSTPEEKLERLKTTGIDYCIWLNFTKELASLSAYEFMRFLRDTYNIRCLVIGHDHRFGHNREEGFNEYLAYGKQLGVLVILARKYNSDNEGISSSAIRNLLQRGDVAKAATFLGYNYALSGVVVGGFKVGSKIGFPTANLSETGEYKLIPSLGVYAVRVWIGDVSYAGMMNVGTRPTLDNGTHQTLEVHILAFTGVLYDQTIRVEFVQYLRPEKKFESLEALQHQLAKDKESVLYLFS
ncbi:MAG: bifunctional riboflavin kinase/FAD synthetase [Phocaeicola sp.]